VTKQSHVKPGKKPLYLTEEEVGGLLMPAAAVDAIEARSPTGYRSSTANRSRERRRCEAPRAAGCVEPRPMVSQRGTSPARPPRSQAANAR
jgi:hypothetical protein